MQSGLHFILKFFLHANQVWGTLYIHIYVRSCTYIHIYVCMYVYIYVCTLGQINFVDGKDL